VTELFNKKSQADLRRKLRNEITKAESALWFHLRKKNFGFRFHRQYGVGKFIVDFYCPKARLVIEVDGDSHYQSLAVDSKDFERQKFLEAKGLKVIRFTNLDVYKNIDGVLEMIRVNLPL
jgi:very-short-patch-repair endonuclease